MMKNFILLYLCLFSVFAADPEAAARAHQAITEDLFNGSVTDMRPFTKNNNRNQIFKVTIYNKATGRSREAIFKPRYYGDGDGWNRVPLEYVTYEVGLLLNTDLIPPVAYRRNFGSNEYHFEEGALIYYVPDSHQLKDVETNLWDLSKKNTKTDYLLFLSDVRILDVLMQNPDRHIDNYMRGKHWVDGVYKPVLIDQAANLRVMDDSIKMTGNDAFGNSNIEVVRSSTLKGLKALNYKKLKKLDEFLTEKEIQYILKKRQDILNYVEGLIHDKGEKNVIINA